jgi:hypothetical protein
MVNMQCMGACKDIPFTLTPAPRVMAVVQLS